MGADMKTILLAVLMAINVAAKADIPGAPSYAQWKQSLDWGADPAYSNYLFDYGYQANGNPTANLAGLGYQEVQDKSAGNQMTLNSLGVMFNPATGHYYLDTAGGVNGSTGWGTPDASTGLIDIGPDLGAASSYATSNRNKNYTGSADSGLAGFLGNFGPALVMGGVGALAAGGAGLGALGDSGWVSGYDLPMGADFTGGGLTNSISSLSNPINQVVAGTSDVAPDLVGSDWATGQATGATGGSLPTTSGGLTAGNTAAEPYDFVGSDWASGSPTGKVGGSLPTTPSGLTAGNTAASPSSGLPNIPTGAKSVLDKIMNGTATASDYAKLAASGVDIAAALASYNRQNQLWDSGADSRARFNQGMTNPSSVMGLFQPAVDQATDSYLRGISAKSGNPATLGSAPAETSKYVFGSTMLPLWNNYEGLNANVGWNAASTKSADAAQGLASATGQAAGTLTNPNSDMTTTLANLKNLGLLPDASKAGSYISSLFGNPA